VISRLVSRRTRIRVATHPQIVANTLESFREKQFPASVPRLINDN
jgi:hypothetical protein